MDFGALTRLTRRMLRAPAGAIAGASMPAHGGATPAPLAAGKDAP